MNTGDIAIVVTDTDTVLPDNWTAITDYEAIFERLLERGGCLVLRSEPLPKEYRTFERHGLPGGEIVIHCFNRKETGDE